MNVVLYYTYTTQYVKLLCFLYLLNNNKSLSLALSHTSSFFVFLIHQLKFDCVPNYFLYSYSIKPRVKVILHENFKICFLAWQPLPILAILRNTNSLTVQHSTSKRDAIICPGLVSSP